MTSDSQAFATSPESPIARPGWSGGRLMTGAALIVVLIALFLPWFSKLMSGPALGPPLVSGIDGPAAHGFLWAVLALAIASLVLIVVRQALGRLPYDMPGAEQMLAGATGIAFLLCLLGVASRPPAVSYVQTLVWVRWSYGGFIAVVAAEVALAFALWTARRPQPAGSAQPPARSGPQIR